MSFPTGWLFATCADSDHDSKDLAVELTKDVLSKDGRAVAISLGNIIFGSKDVELWAQRIEQKYMTGQPKWSQEMLVRSTHMFDVIFCVRPDWMTVTANAKGRDYLANLNSGFSDGWEELKSQYNSCGLPWHECQHLSRLFGGYSRSSDVSRRSRACNYQ